MIYFREVKEPYSLPADEAAFKYWHIEYYDDKSIDGGRMFPVGVAYIVEVPDHSASLQYMIMADQWRGRGFAKELLRAAKARWPSLTWSGATSRPGAALLKSVGMINDTKELDQNVTGTTPEAQTAGGT